MHWRYGILHFAEKHSRTFLCSNAIWIIKTHKNNWSKIKTIKLNLHMGKKHSVRTYLLELRASLNPMLKPVEVILISVYWLDFQINCNRSCFTQFFLSLKKRFHAIRIKNALIFQRKPNENAKINLTNYSLQMKIDRFLFSLSK